ncbi:MAG: YbaK/EbsC family protein [Parachlamydiaceae bacterium]
MSVSGKIKRFLEQEKINYQILEHNPAFTALEIAQAQHLPGHQVVKTVVVDADGKQILCVLPSTHKIDFDRLKKMLNAQNVALTNETQVGKLFPEYEIGAMPPFGRTPDLKVYVDKDLAENESIAFNAGTHVDMLKIRFKDFVKIATPTFGTFGIHI